MAILNWTTVLAVLFYAGLHRSIILTDTCMFYNVNNANAYVTVGHMFT